MQKVSIITATFNNGNFLQECIESVLAQSYEDWEWIIVNNGSTDQTADLLNRLTDKRIERIDLPENVGVSAARNVALAKMTGNAFCFLDGDDVLPRMSISARAELLFANPQVDFVDGQVISFRRVIDDVVDVYSPAFSGDPLPLLLMISNRVFKGNTWMIRNRQEHYSFDDGLRHGEELLLYLGLAKGGSYTYTKEPVLYYRQHEGSAMRDVKALAKSYMELADRVAILKHITPVQKAEFRKRVRRIASKSLIKHGYYIPGFRMLFDI